MITIRKNLFRIIGLAVLVLFSVNIVKYLVSPSPDQVRADDRRQAQRVVPGLDDADPLPEGQWLGGNGIVEPNDRETQVTAAVPGRISQIFVHEGQIVEANTILIELENEVEKARVSTAEAEVAAARAELMRLARGNRIEDIEAAQAEAEAASARNAIAQSSFTRVEAVRDSGGVSSDELDRVRQEAEVENATTQAANARRRAVVAGPRREEIMVARAQLDAAIARQREAQAFLDQLIIRAPIHGEILQLKYRVGEYAQPGQTDPLIIIGDTGTLHVRMDVDERDVGDVHLDNEVLVRAIAYRNRNFRGRVIEIGHRMGRKNVRTDDPTDRNDTKILEVVIALDQSEGLIVGQRVMSYVRRNAHEK